MEQAQKQQRTTDIGKLGEGEGTRGQMSRAAKKKKVAKSIRNTFLSLVIRPGVEQAREVEEQPVEAKGIGGKGVFFVLYCTVQQGSIEKLGETLLRSSC